ncbi:MAG: hypothetical protein JXB00_17880 [Bacteroidales bacterium]|nr:hypothetical protein [Bacteroidales bacterium]
MKKIMTLAVVTALLCSGCKYFEKKRLFSKGADTMLNYAAEIEEPAVDSMAFVPETDVKSEENLSAETLDEMYKTNASLGSDKAFMVVGCFMIPQNADGYAEKMRGMGYNTEIILRPDGFHMVSVSSYDNLRSAVRDLQKFRGEITGNAWIWLKK